MSEHSERKAEEAKPLSVEQLLRFKKSERPDDAFWNNFDRELHQRLFQTVLQKRPGRVRVVFSFLLRPKLALAMPVLAALLIAVGFAVTRNSEPVVSPMGATIAAAVDMVLPVEASASVTPASAREHYVDDSLNMTLDNGNFRKVMSTQAINLTSSGSIRYVADPLGYSAHSGVLSSGSTF